MTKVVFDASALLALLKKEPGYEIAEKLLDSAVMSTVNMAEVVTVLVANDMPIDKAKHVLAKLMPNYKVLDLPQAYLVATLRKQTKKFGLSFGDRACLSLAKTLNLPVLTADKIWRKLDIGLTIQLLRQ